MFPKARRELLAQTFTFISTYILFRIYIIPDGSAAAAALCFGIFAS